MAKQSLLDMTQEILSAMSSDEVNSISDTTESLQVATIIKRKYYDIISRGDLPEHMQPISLDPSNDITMPVLMYIPAGVSNLEWIKYFNSDTDSPGYQYITILPTQQFIDMTSGFNTDDTNVDTFTFNPAVNGFPNSFTFYYKNDKQPSYCTIIANKYVIFDGYDDTLDTTLQTSKIMAFGKVVPTFTMADTFIPQLEDNQFSLLVNEAKALAYYELKQTPHQKAEQEIKRQWSATQRNKATINRPTHFDQLPNFGRPPSGGTFGYPRIRLH